MTEIGLVHFAKCALGIATKVLPLYRSKYSKHTFSQPQLLAILCLMRYEDWTFRETEVRLQEHVELRKALGLKQALDYTTLYRFMRRLDPEMIQLLWRKRPCKRGKTNQRNELCLLSMPLV